MVILVRINGASLRVIRERTGLSVTALADRVSAGGVSLQQPHLSNIEAGRRNPSPEVAVALAAALEVELAAILLTGPEGAAA